MNDSVVGTVSVTTEKLQFCCLLLESNEIISPSCVKSLVGGMLITPWALGLTVIESEIQSDVVDLR